MNEQNSILSTPDSVKPRRKRRSSVQVAIEKKAKALAKKQREAAKKARDAQKGRKQAMRWDLGAVFGQVEAPKRKRRSSVQVAIEKKAKALAKKEREAAKKAHDAQKDRQQALRWDLGFGHLEAPKRKRRSSVQVAVEKKAKALAKKQREAAKKARDAIKDRQQALRWDLGSMFGQVCSSCCSKESKSSCQKRKRSS
jgi:hypothetical protein